jgi:hypothetical protein
VEEYTIIIDITRFTFRTRDITLIALKKALSIFRIVSLLEFE